MQHMMGTETVWNCMADVLAQQCMGCATTHLHDWCVKRQGGTSQLDDMNLHPR